MVVADSQTTCFKVLDCAKTDTHTHTHREREGERDDFRTVQLRHNEGPMIHNHAMGGIRSPPAAR